LRNPSAAARSHVASTRLIIGIVARRSTSSNTMCGVFAAMRAISAPARVNRSTDSDT
jgi:hypothetical protein